MTTPTGNQQERLAREKVMSTRVIGLLIFAFVILIGQSVQNLSNLDQVDDSIVTAHETVVKLDNLANRIAGPMADIRILSMQLALAPNHNLMEGYQKEIQEIKGELNEELKRMDTQLNWVEGGEDDRESFSAIFKAWQGYERALKDTLKYAESGVRVATFISVTQQEEKAFEDLQKALEAYRSNNRDESEVVYEKAQDDSTFAFLTLMATSFVEIVLLLSVLYFIYRMFKNYVRTSKAFEEKIRESRQQMQIIMDNIPSMVLMKDREGRHLIVNHFYEEARGIKLEDIVGKRDDEVFPSKIAEKIMTKDRKVMESGESLTYDEEICHTDGSTHQFMMTKVPLLDKNGKVMGLCGLATDVSELQKAKQAIEKNEERFRSLTNNVQGVIYRGKLDRRFTMLYLNPYFQELTGYRVDEFIGEKSSISFADIIHPDDLDVVYDQVKAALAEGQTYSMQYRLIHQDGHIVHVFEQGHASFEHMDDFLGEEPDFIDGFIVDISERKIVEDALEQNRSLLQSVFDAIPDLIFAKGIEGEFLQINTSVEHLMGKNSNEVIGMTDHDLFNEEVADAFRKEDQRMMESGQAHRYEEEIEHPDGNKVLYDTLKSPFYSKDGALLGLLGISRDITERKMQEEALEEAKDKAESATKAKGDFLANMSHEIRTPMNAIIGLSHLALNTELNRKQQDYLSKISAAANNLLGIINDILDFSKIEAGKLDMEAIPFDLSESMENFANVVAVKASEKDLELIVDLQPDVPLDLKGDPLRLNQILVNLANNAVKFTEEGEIEIKIEREQDIEEDVVLKFSVRDSGIGMTPEQQGKLFQAFSQADTSTTRKFGGTGLGLTISKSLVELMNGEIGVESEAGVGSTFFFTARFGKGKGQAKRRDLSVPMELDDIRVLVVDDNPTSRTIFCRYLESFEFDAEEAKSGAEALEKLKEAKPAYDLVLMDWKMPGLNGLDTVRRIQAEPDIPQKPRVILVSAYGREELRDEAEHLGIDTYLVKPVNPSTLLDGILETFGQGVENTTVTRGLGQNLGNFRGTHLLLVEDNEINQQVAEEILADQGITITIADNGQLGVDALLKDPDAYEAILMDIQMPVMDGYTATRTIRRDERFKELPIIAMTANAMAGDRERALEAGMNDHVAKPIDVKELFAVLSNFIKPKEGSGDINVSKEESSTDLPELEGIHQQAGLERVGGKVNLYKKILIKFRETQGETVEKIRAALNESDRDTARREAHTLKGLAGNIGAEALQEKGAGVETAIVDSTEDEEMLVSLETELRSVMEALVQLGETQEEKGHKVSEVELEKGLAELKELLEEDDADSVEKLQDLASALPPSLVKKMTQALEGYDFEDALDQLNDFLI